MVRVVPGMLAAKQGGDMSDESTKISRRAALQTALALGAYSAGGARLAIADEAPVTANRLWYQKPAQVWTEALPIGNGRIGAMIFGGVAHERLQLNDDTLYAGGPYDPSDPAALIALPQVRKLIADGRYKEAQDLADQKLMAHPLRMPSYQTVGELVLTSGASSFAGSYERDLDLDAAVAGVRYSQDGIAYTREMFASPVDDVIVVRLKSDAHRALNLRVAFETPMPGDVRIDGDTLVLAGTNVSQEGLPATLKYEARVRALVDGDVALRDGEIVVTRAQEVVLLVAIATSYRRYDDVSGDPAAVTRARLDAAAAKSFGALRDAHVAEHRRLFRRVSLDLGTTPAAGKPTDTRIRNSATTDDPALAALYFQYARYLLISCSRPGTQPANLQGLWNDMLTAPWGSKYTININTEMNYWPAESANLAECVAPLMQMVREIAVTGARTARVNYGARGWVAHHNTDIWRGTGAIDGAQWGLWPMGGAWLCQNLWDHYDYARDRAFLTELYPLMKGAAEFFLDTLVHDEKSGGWITSPTLSPENHHPFGASLCAGPAMDRQLLRDLFAHCIEAAAVLGVDRKFGAACAAARAKLPADRIGKAGQLQEWLEDWDLEVPEPQHRHVSHLYGLYPSGQISLRGTPALAAAARKSLELRGDLATGWAIAWRINLWARLREGAHAHSVLKLLLDPSRTYPNMFDAHPPFQIDGNFGGAAGIAEMLLQCVDDEVVLLPALPPAWPTGSVRGLRARGGFELDISWRDGKLERVEMRGTPGGSAKVRLGESLRTVKVGKGAAQTLTAASFA